MSKSCARAVVEGGEEEGGDEEEEEYEVELSTSMLTRREQKVSNRVRPAMWPIKSRTEGLTPGRGRLLLEDPRGKQASGQQAPAPAP